VAGGAAPELADDTQDEFEYLHEHLANRLIELGRLSEAAEVVQLGLAVVADYREPSWTVIEAEAVTRIGAAWTKAAEERKTMARPWAAAARAWAEVKRMAGLDRYGAHSALFTLGTELHTAGLTMELAAAARQAGVDELHAAMRKQGLAALPADCRADTAILHYIVESDRATVLVRVGETESVVCISSSFGTVAFNGLANEILNGAATMVEDPRSMLRKAFDILLAPIVDKLADVTRVIVAAPGGLHGIPWGAPL
jgi:hypothetical protein